MGLEGGAGVKWLEGGEIYSGKGREGPEDARNLVETATLAGAVIGSGKPFKEGESAVEENISN
jgi:hypothetical protein